MAAEASFRVNGRVIDLVDGLGIRRDDALGCLITLYYHVRPGYVPPSVKGALEGAGIFTDGPDGMVTWHVPLFEGAETAFGWVRDEYCALFREVSPDRPVYAAESLRRMKKFFAEHPDIRKDEVMAATRMYLRATDPNFVRQPNYFISKGGGADRQDPLLNWVERYREEVAAGAAERVGRRVLL